MARSHSHIIGAGPRRQAAPGAGGAGTTLTVLGASLVLVTPIVLWLRLGDGAHSSLKPTVLVVATTLLCWALVRLVGAPHRARALPAAPQPQAAPAPRCSSGGRRSAPVSTPLPRMRGGTPARGERPAARRPVRGCRTRRDVRCGAPAHRTARRRTRP